MNKRIAGIIALTFLTIIMFSNFYLEISNDISLLEFLRQPKQLSDEQRAWIKDHGPLIYGADNNSPPLRFVDEEGQYSGIVVDYLRALSIELGVEVVYKPLVWAEALEALEEGKTDICDMYPSEERAKKYLFTEPIYNQKGVILAPRSKDWITTHHDLAGKRVALQKGDYVHEFLSSEVSGVIYHFTPDYYQAIMLLIAGEVDAVVGDEPVLSYFIDELAIEDTYAILENELYEKESIFAIPKDDKQLLSILNYGISVLKKKNTMEKIHQKWFGISAPFIKENTMQKYLHISMIALYIFIVSSYLFFLWSSQLKKEVEKRTKELYISQNELETTFDGLIHLMIVLDENHMIVNVNTSFCSLVEKDRDQIIGTSVMDYPELLYTTEIRQLLKKTFKDRSPSHLEIRKDSMIYEMSILPLKDDNTEDIHRVLIMLKDITTLRISEQRILQSNKMSAVGHLASGVAHEIRNPLGLIRNYCYVLKKDESLQQGSTYKAIEVIESSVDKVSNIIMNLLDFSRISDDSVDSINLYDFIQTILTLEYKVVKKNNISEKLICDPEITCRIQQEPLKHILINCISNAVDAMKDGGELEIAVEKTDDQLIIICSDTGTGIEEEELEKIYNPFFTTKKQHEGTGLGLYVTYNEVQKLGGDISVDSRIGEGTAFTIRIPV